MQDRAVELTQNTMTALLKLIPDLQQALRTFNLAHHHSPAVRRR